MENWDCTMITWDYSGNQSQLWVLSVIILFCVKTANFGESMRRFTLWQLKVVIENGQGSSEFSHEKQVIVHSFVNVYQRVYGFAPSFLQINILNHFWADNWMLYNIYSCFL